MKKTFNVCLILIGIFAAIGIGHDWYSGYPAHWNVWVLAICGALSISESAAERAFPFLRD